jgi:hypothetical protein
MPPEATVREAALGYAAKGSPIFPIAPSTKAPHGKLAPHGFKSATVNAKAIESWWRVDSSIDAIATEPGAGGYIVLDFDDRHGGDTSRDAMESEHGELPATRTAITPGGGEHRWYTLPDGVKIQSRNGVRQGVDIKSSGGYVLLPPSRHPSGGEYRWAAGGERIAELPPAWIEALTETTARESTPIGEDAGGAEGIPNGSHDDFLHKYGSWLRGRWGLDEGAIADALRAAITSGVLCDIDPSAPYTEQDIARLAKSVARYSHPGGVLVDDTTSATFPKVAAAHPTLYREACIGLAGDVVRIIGPQSEGDEVAILTTFLSAYGNAVGLGPHIQISGVTHRARLNCVHVGPTAQGRKGQAYHDAMYVLREAAPDWYDAAIVSGLGSGEGLLQRLGDGDGTGGPARGAGDPAPDSIVTLSQICDPAIGRRAFVYEPEFARLLSVAGREGATLSPIIRDAWDQTRLELRVRKSPIVVHDAHVSVIAQITPEELRTHLCETERANGFANRFMFVAVRRARKLPFGGDFDAPGVAALVQDVRAKIAVGQTIGAMTFAQDARKHWAELYYRIGSSQRGGLAGALQARAESHILRLALVYALLDGSQEIRVEHVRAGEALWQYCSDSTRYIFGDALGDEIAQRLLDEARAVYPRGVSREQQHQLFGRHVPAARIKVAVDHLIQLGLGALRTVQTKGRSRREVFATSVSS